MKRITISIIIGAAFCLLALGIIKLLDKRINNTLPNQASFNSELKIKVGNSNDDIHLIKRTMDQIQTRISSDNFSLRQIDKNTFELSVKGIADTVTFKKLLTESVRIEFTEVFKLDEIQNSIVMAEEVLDKRRKKYLETLESDTKLLSAQLEVTELARKNGYGKLAELINFSQPYQGSNGSLLFPASLGYIKKQDTANLNKIFSDQEILMNFPERIKLAYGDYFESSPNNDSLMAIYPLKIGDQSFNANPSSDQIIDAEFEFEPSTGSPVIVFAFNSRGSEAWFRMTERNISKPIAILLNDIVLTAPVVESAIEGGKIKITGKFTIDEAMFITAMLRSGKLILPVKTIEHSFVASKKSKKIIWILAIVFLTISLLSYGISFFIKSVSKS